MRAFVSHLEAAIDGTLLEAGTLHTVHKGRPIWVRYDLDAMADCVDRDALASREASLWRYRECLPLAPDNEPVTLGYVRDGKPAQIQFRTAATPAPR